MVSVTAQAILDFWFLPTRDQGQHQFRTEWFGKNDAYYYLSADYRRSPVLTLDNALIGQGVQDLNALVESGGFTEKTLEEVALDRAIHDRLALQGRLNFASSTALRKRMRAGVTPS